MINLTDIPIGQEKITKIIEPSQLQRKSASIQRHGAGEPIEAEPNLSPVKKGGLAKEDSASIARVSHEPRKSSPLSSSFINLKKKAGASLNFIIEDKKQKNENAGNHLLISNSLDKATFSKRPEFDVAIDLYKNIININKEEQMASIKILEKNKEIKFSLKTPKILGEGSVGLVYEYVGHIFDLSNEEALVTSLSESSANVSEEKSLGERELIFKTPLTNAMVNYTDLEQDLNDEYISLLEIYTRLHMKNLYYKGIGIQHLPYGVVKLPIENEEKKGLLARKYIYGDLNKFLKENKISLEMKTEFSIHLLRTSIALHATEFYHGDYKPGNVLVGSSGKLYFGDFGSSRAKDDIRDFPPFFSQAFCFTKHVDEFNALMRDKNKEGAHDVVSKKMDVVSLSIIIYQIFSNGEHFPYASMREPEEFIDDILRDNGCPEEIIQIIKNMSSPDDMQRITEETALELFKDFAKNLKEQNVKK